jgi:heme exporter protein C
MIWFWAACVIVNLGGFAYVLLGIPFEASQGAVQKIFFFHVPAAFCMYAGLFAAAVGSVVYLIKKSSVADCVARAGMKTAFVFGLIVLTSGPLWAKPIWGVYWTWDPRLTTTFVVFLLILGYLFARNIFDDRQAQARGALVGAILALLAVAHVPIIHLSVKLWRGVHPSVLRNPEGLPPTYSLGLQIMILAFFLLAFGLGYLFYQTEKGEEASHGNA